jgi:hypothetical protein
MDRDDVISKLSQHVAATSDPVLDDTALGELVDDAAVADSGGLLPTDTGWAGAWDLYAAAAAGWRRKAGVVSDRFKFAADGATYERQQMFEHFLTMAGWYAARAGSLIVGDTNPLVQQARWTSTRTVYTERDSDWWEDQVV